jgi:two-component system, chemotaxis family, chemotaxis protein CheY
MAVRVLMVDDSVFVRDVLRHHLECIGCEVVAEAENTAQALDLYRTVKPSLITLDITIPRTGGRPRRARTVSDDSRGVSATAGSDRQRDGLSGNPPIVFARGRRRFPG